MSELLIERREGEVVTALASKHVYCYQVGCGDCFKVGWTRNNPEERRRGFATGSPVNLNLYKEIETEYPSELETYIHQLLDEKRTENGEFFKVTAQELDGAIRCAVAFVEEFQPLFRQADKLRRNQPNDTMVESSAEMLRTYRELRALRSQRYLIEQHIAFLESKIQVAIGDSSGMRGIASWKWMDRWTMDMARFRREQDALYQAYKRNSGSRRFRLEGIDLTRAD